MTEPTTQTGRAVSDEDFMENVHEAREQRIDAARDGWDALLAQTLVIRPIIDAEIARRDRIAAGDKTAGSMPPAEWDALASLPATANLPARYLDLASPDAERRLAAAIEQQMAMDPAVAPYGPDEIARAILATLRQHANNQPAEDE